MEWRVETCQSCKGPIPYHTENALGFWRTDELGNLYCMGVKTVIKRDGIVERDEYLCPTCKREKDYQRYVRGMSILKWKGQTFLVVTSYDGNGKDGVPLGFLIDVNIEGWSDDPYYLATLLEMMEFGRHYLNLSQNSTWIDALPEFEGEYADIYDVAAPININIPS